MILDPRLESSSSFVINLDLCQVRLSHNAAFPWLLLIPQPKNIIEIIDLNPCDQALLMQEIALASQVMKNLFQPDKLNVASLGNVVSQLHVHIIARYQTDQAWPNPIWNTAEESYTAEKKAALIDQIKRAFKDLVTYYSPA